MDKITIVAQKRFQTKFPARAESEVEITTHDEEVFLSGEMSARWDAGSDSPTDRELEEKFLWLTGPVLGKERARGLKETVMNFDRENSLEKLIQQSTLLPKEKNGN